METEPDTAVAYYAHALQLGSCMEACVGIVALVNRYGIGIVGEMKRCAENAVRRCITVYPMQPTAWNAHGLFLEDKANFQKAIFAFQTALSLLQQSQETTMPITVDSLRQNLGRAAWKAQQHELSIQCFESICELDAATRLAYSDALLEVPALQLA